VWGARGLPMDTDGMWVTSGRAWRAGRRLLPSAGDAAPAWARGSLRVRGPLGNGGAVAGEHCGCLIEAPWLVNGVHGASLKQPPRPDCCEQARPSSAGAAAEGAQVIRPRRIQPEAQVSTPSSADAQGGVDGAEQAGRASPTFSKPGSPDSSSFAAANTFVLGR
jgi:hypothetical protein